MATRETFYVHRTNADGREGYVGPLPRARADRERAAWIDSGWMADIIPVTPETRAVVRAWEDSRPAFSPHGFPITKKRRR